MIDLNFLKNKVNSILEKLPYYLPLIYVNLCDTNYVVKTTVYSLYLYNVYNHREYYLCEAIDIICKAKLMVKQYFKKYGLHKEFTINKVLLYTNLNNFIDVSSYFNGRVKEINKNTIETIYKLNNMKMVENDDIRLKIFYTYKENEYIKYFSYNRLIHKDYGIYELPIPFYNKEIIENYRNDIVKPYYTKDVDKKIFYSLFSMESKDIHTVEINDCKNDKLIEYFNKIKGPFNDYGILYHTPVKVKWVIAENNIDLDSFKKLYLKFMSVYFDDILMDIKEHFIEMDETKLENIIISERMKEILLWN